MAYEYKILTFIYPEEEHRPGAIDWSSINDMPLLAAMMNKNDFKNLTCICAYDDGTVVGMGVIDPDGYPLYAKLCCLEVKADYRNRGIGHELLRQALYAFDEIKLVAARNVVPFYEKCGFREVPRKYGKLDANAPVIEMYNIV